MASVTTDKPNTADDYPPELAHEAKAMCLYVATILGDQLEDLVLVGGLVPYLIVDQDDANEAHVGSGDLDLGFSIGVLSDEKYREVSARLRDRGFEPFKNEAGNEKRQMWHIPGKRVTIDFLIGPVPDGARPGKLQNLEADFAAIVTEALPLAFIDCVEVHLDGTTTAGEKASRSVRVCGPAAFVVLKAYAFVGRGKNKDAYDLVYVLRNFGDEIVTPVAKRFTSIAGTSEARKALEILARDFETPDHLGPKRYAAFLGDPDNEDWRQDATGAVQAFLKAVGSGAGPT